VFLNECRPTFQRYVLPPIIIALMMEAVRTSETTVDIQLRTRHYIPEDSEIHTRRRENLKSHILSHYITLHYMSQWRGLDINFGTVGTVNGRLLSNHLSQYSVWLRTGRPGDRGSIPGRGKEFFL
jgi:hypothetical protein